MGKDRMIIYDSDGHLHHWRQPPDYLQALQENAETLHAMAAAAGMVINDPGAVEVALAAYAPQEELLTSNTEGLIANQATFWPIKLTYYDLEERD